MAKAGPGTRHAVSRQDAACCMLQGAAGSPLGRAVRRYRLRGFVRGQGSGSGQTMRSIHGTKVDTLV